MRQLHSFHEAHDALADYIRPTGMTGGYTLDAMRNFMDYLDNPQEQFKAIHVAGTSGKTSTCYYAAGLLKEAGMMVGHTVSPHVDEINERAQIDLAPLPEEEYCEELSAFLDIVDESEFTLSYFEIHVAFAYWLFAKRHVDYAVIEVGLGGLLDGTNIITNPDKISVITDIGLDHVEVLGNTMEEIAFQKAGIIHPGNHVFMNQQSEIVENVVADVCAEKEATLHVVPAEQAVAEAHEIPFQVRNFALAREVVSFALAQEEVAISRSQIQAAKEVYIPARLEEVSYKSKQVLLDGSHNAQKMHALVEGVQHRYSRGSTVVVVSLGGNKVQVARDALQELAAVADKVIVTSFSLNQDEVRKAINPHELAKICREIGIVDVVVQEDPIAAFEAAVADERDKVLVTGSYFLLNHIRPMIAAQA